jgi:DNA-binding CsgD family transcriptional regulator
VVARDELFEREHELAVLDGLVEQVGRGGTALALIEGPAGIGKSRLLGVARDKARAAGFRVLWARGSDFERRLPFGVARQLFEPALATSRDRWLSGSALAAARVFDPSEVGNPATDAGFAVLYGLSWLTANIAADGPLLLAVEDLHWCDRASLQFLAYLLRPIEDYGVLVVAAVRDGEPSMDPKLLSEIAQDPAAVLIRPSPLTESAVGELIRQRLGSTGRAGFVEVCHRATGGNPLLLHEVIKAMETDGVRADGLYPSLVRDVGPRAVLRSVLLRLARLPAEAAALARAVAVLGDGAGVPAIAAFSELDEARVAVAARALAAAEILRSRSPLGFVHPLVRDAVYLDLAPAERELLHEQAAKVLVELEAPPELIATHLLIAPRRSDRAVAARLRDAGRAAMARSDPDNAVAYLRRALAEPPSVEQRPSLLVDLGLAEAFANEKVASAEHLAAGYEAITDPQERATVAETLVRVLLFTAPASEAAKVARRAVDQLGPELDDSRLDDSRWKLEALELFSVNLGAHVPDAGVRLEQARDGLRGRGPGARMLAAVVATDWALSGGTAVRCCELAMAALADGALIADDPSLMMPSIVASILALAGRDEALAVWEAAIAQGHRGGSKLALSGLYVSQAGAWLARGQLEEAEDTLRRANDAAEPLHSATAEWAYGSAFMAQVLIERGDIAGARELLSRQPPMPPGADADGLSRRAETELLLAERRWDEALAAADRYRDTLRDRIVNPAWAPWRSLRAEALIGLQRRDEAVELLEQELGWARRWGAPGAVSQALRLLAMAEPGDRLDVLEEAAATSEDSSAQLVHAKALIALGSALRRARKPSVARDPLRRGLELAARCGATPLAKRARTELYAAGGRPRRDALTGPDSLTPSERRVAALAAEGQANRDIAQALFVTPKTVEFHLTCVYRKLGISTRAGLIDAMAGH